MLHSMWDLSSLVRNQIHMPPASVESYLTTGLPGKYISFICLLLVYFWTFTLNLFINLPSLLLLTFCSGWKPFSPAHSCACTVSMLFPVPTALPFTFLLCVHISRSNVILQGTAQTWSFPAFLWPLDKNKLHVLTFHRILFTCLIFYFLSSIKYIFKHNQILIISQFNNFHSIIIS